MQAKQIPPSALEYPAGQLRQDELEKDPSEDDVPAEQLTHEVAPETALAYEPAPQTLQDDAPLMSLNDPGGHAEQLPKPVVSSVNVPDKHFVN